MKYFLSSVLQSRPRLGLAICLLLIASCGQSSAGPDATETVDAELVDLLFHNGQILIVDKAFSVRSALAVADG